MLSAFKRLTSPKSENGTSQFTSHQTMSQNLQRKFARGIQYNMKIIIKGDRNTGKTCLFERLQGKKFVQEYVPTEEIQVASIQWNYKTSEDVVKVEVWDVVDKAKKRPTIEGLKLTGELQPALDAEFLDVYKGTNGVILVMDVTKNWTFDYVQKEMERIPEHIPVVVVGNHCDMSHHRTVNQDTVTYFIETIQRARPSTQIRYTEASMSNGFGLKYLHKFFCLPFLQLQRETLRAQLQTNENEMAQTIAQLDQFQRGPDSDYNVFLENLSKRRREMADSSGVAVSANRNLSEPVRQPSIIVGLGKPIEKSETGARNTASPFSHSKSSDTSRCAAKRVVSTVEEPSGPSVTSLEEFVPDEGHLDKSFLDDLSSHHVTLTDVAQESDSDADAGENPMVTGYQDDVDPEDMQIFNTTVSTQNDEEIVLNNKETSRNETLVDWIGCLNLAEGRESPEGGEDSAYLDSSCINKKKNEKNKKHVKKTKTHKEKDEVTKADKKKKKKKSSCGMTNDSHDLESFLSSHDLSYEAI
uniref:Putative gtpase rab1/ypt1 small g protein n=1 Tax=Panstrongylus lignarius TaxID=156445 RepID=A0A224XNA6_9HEMI